MRRLIVQQWVTADTFVAEEDGRMSFVSVEPFALSSDDDFKASAMDFIDSVDTMILGANTYAMARSYWPTADDQGAYGEKLNRLAKFVGSTNLRDAPWGTYPAATVTRDAVATIRELKRACGPGAFEEETSRKPHRPDCGGRRIVTGDRRSTSGRRSHGPASTRGGFMRNVSLFVCSVLLLLVASCRNSGDPTGRDTTGIHPYPLSGVAAGYPGGGTTLDAVAWTTEPGPGLVGYVVDASGTGAIANDGTFSVTLDVMNRHADVEHMMSFSDLPCDGLVVDPPSGLYLVVDRIQVLQDAALIGTIVLASSAEAAESLDASGDRMVSWIYVPSETFVSGDCPGYGTYYMDLAPGWNAVESLKPTDGASPEVDRTVVSDTPWASWFYVGN